MAFRGPLNLHVPQKKPEGRWGRSILASRLPGLQVAGQGALWAIGASVEMANEVVGKDR